MFDFDRTPEQIRQQLDTWDGIDRRLAANAAFRIQVDRAFPKPKTVICQQCGEHQSGPRHADGISSVNWVVCTDCQSGAVATVTDTEPRYIPPCECGGALRGLVNLILTMGAMLAIYGFMRLIVLAWRSF